MLTAMWWLLAAGLGLLGLLFGALAAMALADDKMARPQRVFTAVLMAGVALLLGALAAAALSEVMV
jgi:predicted benzoate:H+ symporter BenE